MKKILKPALVVIFFLLIAGAVAFAIARKNVGVPGEKTTGAGFPTGTVVNSSASVDASPTTFASGFYAWYLSNLEHDQGFIVSDSFANDVTKWLTPEFIAEFPRLIDETGTSPILLAQDYYASWMTSITSKVATQSATEADVIVTLGKDTETHKLLLHLVKKGSQWLISSIQEAPQP